MNQEFDQVGRKLREYDPARDRELGEKDARQMRARILDSAGEPERPTWRRPALAFAAIVLAVIAGWFAIAPNLSNRANLTPVAHMEPVIPVDEEPLVQDDALTRQVQYTTPGGTRVVWTLDPDFEL